MWDDTRTLYLLTKTDEYLRDVQTMETDPADLYMKQLNLFRSLKPQLVKLLPSIN